MSRKMREEEDRLTLERNRAEAAMREAIEEEGRMLQKRMMVEKMERKQKERERILEEERQRRMEEEEEEERRAEYERDLIELERRRQQQLADVDERARRERARRDQERAMRERELREKLERERAELERLNEEMEILNRDEEVIVEKRAELTKPNQFRKDWQIDSPDDDRRYRLVIPLVLTTPLLFSVFTGVLFPKAVQKSTGVTIDGVHRTNASELVNPFNKFRQRILVQVCNLFSHTPFLQKQAVPTKTIRNQESDGD